MWTSSGLQNFDGPGISEISGTYPKIKHCTPYNDCTVCVLQLLTLISALTSLQFLKFDCGFSLILFPYFGLGSHQVMQFRLSNKMHQNLFLLFFSISYRNIFWCIMPIKRISTKQIITDWFFRRFWRYCHTQSSLKIDFQSTVVRHFYFRRWEVGRMVRGNLYSSKV